MTYASPGTNCNAAAPKADTFGQLPEAKVRAQEKAHSFTRDLPMDFTENRGQWDESIHFIARQGTVSAACAARQAIESGEERGQPGDADANRGHETEDLVESVHACEGA